MVVLLIWCPMRLSSEWWYTVVVPVVGVVPVGVVAMICLVVLVVLQMVRKPPVGPLREIVESSSSSSSGSIWLKLYRGMSLVIHQLQLLLNLVLNPKRCDQILLHGCRILVVRDFAVVVGFVVVGFRLLALIVFVEVSAVVVG